MSTRVWWSTFAVCLVVTACGGGGGGGGGSGTAVGLNSGNAEKAADAALDATESSFDLASLGSGFVKPGSGSGSFNVASFVRRKLERARTVARQQSRGSYVTIPDGGSCDDGGAWSEVHEDNDNDGDLSTGDTFVFTFSGCTDASFDIVVDGVLLITNIVVTGDVNVPDYTMSATLTFQNLELTTFGETFGVNGVLAVSLTELNDDLSFTLTFTNFGLSYGSETTTLQSATIQYAENGLSGAYQWTASGTLLDTALGGTITFQTTSPIVGNFLGADYPNQGVLEVHGAGNSAVRITVLDATQVQIETDADGDGTYEGLEVVLWADLE